MNFKVGDKIRVKDFRGFSVTMINCWEKNPIQTINTIHINSINSYSIRFSHTDGGNWSYYKNSLIKMSSKLEKNKTRLMK